MKLYKSNFIHKSLSNKVLGACFKVHNALGPGLIESAYQGALVTEFKRSGIVCELQKVFPLTYAGEYVGAFFADIVVANTIILELKSVAGFTSGMVSQTLNYLKLSKLPVAYLLNFNGPRVVWQRFVNTKGSS
ncbi:MAG: GxxExxY protein [Spirochaetales bacterium]|nr:GxxExxY protein [Spirochaetales bacterium]